RINPAARHISGRSKGNGRGVAMTNPGFMGQQAAQQAAAAASRGAQQTAATSYGMTVQAASNAGRRSHYRPHSNYRPHRRVGFFGMIGRLVSLVFTLVIIAVAVGIFLVILSQAQPDWFTHIKAWFNHTF